MKTASLCSDYDEMMKMPMMMTMTLVTMVMMMTMVMVDDDGDDNEYRDASLLFFHTQKSSTFTIDMVDG